MTELELQVIAWTRRAYPDYARAAAYRHLLEEVGELGEAMLRITPSGSGATFAAEEAADCSLILTHLTYDRSRLSLDGLVRDKLAILEERLREGTVRTREGRRR